MVKTSFRLSEDTLKSLAEIADKCHNGNRTAAIAAAVERYWHAVLDPVAEVFPVGWVSVRVNKARCAKCRAPIDGPGFAQLYNDGRIDAALHCGKCAK